MRRSKASRGVGKVSSSKASKHVSNASRHPSKASKLLPEGVTRWLPLRSKKTEGRSSKPFEFLPDKGSVGLGASSLFSFRGAPGTNAFTIYSAVALRDTMCGTRSLGSVYATTAMNVEDVTKDV